LGLRAIRLCLQQKEFFKVQLRAIFRANKEGNIRVMFPLVSTVDEIEEVKEFFKRVQEELKREGEEFKEKMKIGAMIETPSAALIVDHIVSELDFISIGTNDLVQYTLAVDRGNEHVAYLFSPLHPSILRLIKGVIESAHKHGKWVSMCGEMASIPECAPFLLGLGLDEFSMAAENIPSIKKTIRAFTLSEAKEVAAYALSLKREEEVSKFLKDALKRGEDA
jgi:phosphotransferase system enzyme I (PtsI)